MTRERTLTSLRLIPVTYDGRPGWIQAKWERSDGSKGTAYVAARLAKAERWYIARLELATPTAKLLQDVPLARIEKAINADPAIREWVEQSVGRETVELARREAARRRRLTPPKTRRISDDYYRLVAEAYTGAVQNGLPPAKTLAAESGVPLGTVNRWIAEARKRGYLPPTSQGKVSTTMAAKMRTGGTVTPAGRDDG